MRATMMLADSAQAINGKLYLLGGGWSVTGPSATPMAVAMMIEIPWDETNMHHNYRLTLNDADGNNVLLPTKEGEMPLEIARNFEVGRPPGHIPGTPISFVQAVNFGPLPLRHGARYMWELSINGEVNPEWSRGFSVRPPKEEK